MKIFGYMLTFVLVFNLAGALPAFGQTKEEKRAAKIKSHVHDIGVEGKSKMDIRTLDGRFFQGKITNATDDSFTILEKNGIETTLKYTEVKSAGYQGMSRAAKVGLFSGLAAAVTIPLVLILARICNEGGC